MASKFGVQVYPTAQAVGFLDRLGRDLGARPLTVLKILDPHLDEGRTRWLMDWARRFGIPVIFRFVSFFDQRNPSQDPIPHLEELWVNFLVRNRPDGLELFNEPGTDSSSIAALQRYYSRAVPWLRERGIVPVLYNFSTGTSPSGSLTVPSGALIGAHEYAQAVGPGQFDLQVPHHVGRFQLWCQPGADLLITETGVEIGGHRRWGIPPERVMKALDDYYSHWTRVRAWIWFLLGDMFGSWRDYDLAESYNGVLGYLRSAGGAAPATLSTEGGEGMIWRGIDVSGYTGRISSSQLRDLKGKYDLQFVIVQAWGGTPCGVGPNRWALNQVRAAAAADLKVAAYVWPPEAVLDPACTDVLVAMRDIAPLRFVALDVEAGQPVRREHVAALQKMGFHPVIYSSPGEWAKIMKGSVEFADVPYWEANYIRKFSDALGRWNGQWPTLADNPWSPVTRGGWRYSPIWQFRGTTNLEGLSCDLNVCDASWWASAA